MFTVIVLAWGKANQLDANILMQTMIVAVLLEILAIPLMGHLSERIGRCRVYLLGTLLLTLAIMPWFMALEVNNGWLTQLAMIVVLTLGHSMCYAPQTSWFPERFPSHICCSGIALIWQIGSLVGGGILGLTAIKILQMNGGHYGGQAIYIIVLGLLSLIGFACLPETAPGVRGQEHHDWHQH